MDKKRPLTPASATALTVIVFVIFRALQRAGANDGLLYMCGFALVICVWEVVRGLVATFRWSRLVRIMTTPTGLYGRTEAPTANDAESLGLSFSNKARDGIPLGGVGDKIIYYDGPGHISVRAATNSGKTESSSAPICFSLGRHRNVIATAKGAELAVLSGLYRRDVLKQNVIFIDPWRAMKPFGLPSHDFNPVGHFPALAGQQSPELIDKAFAAVMILLPEGANASGENKIFRSLARDMMAWMLIKLAVDEHDTGELVANLPVLKRVLGSAELPSFLQGMRACEAYNGSIRRAGESFSARLEQSSRFMNAVIAEALAALTFYDPASVLGQRTSFSDFNPRDLKTPGKPTSVYIVTPAEKVNLYGSYVGLCLNALIDCCIEANRFEPRVTVVADEFASCGVLPSALPTLFLGRSLGVQLISYVQDVESYSRYGQEASAFTTQAECVLAFSIRSTKDAEEYTKRSGQLSVMTESTNTPWDYGAGGTFAVSLSEKGVPIHRADEFLNLPDFTAALFYKQNPPLIVDLVSYRSVEGWREYSKPMPGAPPLKDMPVKYRA